jgi:signal peptidase I
MLSWRPFSKLRPHHSRKPKADPNAPKPPLHKRLFREWILPLVIVAAVLTPIRASIADWNDVPSGSMRPTILEGDRIYVNKLAYGLRIPLTTAWIARWNSPARGDIVTLKSPDDGIRLVKRIIGLPGDRIALRGNVLIINGQPSAYKVTDPNQILRTPGGRVVDINLVEEQFGGDEAKPHALTLTPGAAGIFDEIVVPKGQYFVMGDNRDMSRDSRVIGSVPLESIYGRADYVALSLDPENSYLPRWDRWFSQMK